jgi:diamine N-acetyltransferase
MLESRTIKLRALEPADVDLLYNWENDSNIWHLSSTLTPFSRFALEQYVMNSHEDLFTTKQLRLMIDLSEDEHVKTIGCVDLFDFDPLNKRAGIGILVVKEERGKGFASKALDLMINYAFNRLRLHQVYSNVLKGQKASLDLFKKKNFEVIGIKRQWVLVEGEWIDEYLLQLINTEYQ